MRRMLIFALIFMPLVASATEKVFDITIEQRKVVQPTESVRVLKGDDVTLRWHSDETVNLHMHGYDIQLNVTADKPAEMHFNASASGRFPVTSHGFGSEHGHSHGHEALLYVEVYPE